MIWLVAFSVFLCIPFVLQLLMGINREKIPDFLIDDEFSPNVLLPASLAIEHFLPKSLRDWDTKRLMSRIVLIYGVRNASFHLQIHFAAKCLGFWMGLVVTAFLCFAAQVSYLYLFAIPLAAIFLYFLVDLQLEHKYKEKNRQLERAFPDFISQVALLTGAGLHVRQAIIRIVRESKKNNPLYKELNVVLDDIEAGISEQQAYSELSERCHVREISNFTGILLQHVRLGGNQMLFELRRMATESWELRKQSARKLGEEASSKLVLPLSIMFIAIVIISIAPAFLSIGLLF